MLEVTDPPPVLAVEGTGRLLMREHAGREVSGALGDLGVSDQDRVDHPAWSAGALKWALAS